MMVTYWLDQIYSIKFFVGGLCGFLIQRAYCYQRRNWEDRHCPLPNGERHTLKRISRLWIAAGAAILSLGYVLLTAQKTHDQTLALTEDVTHCWQESYQSARAQIRLNTENDTITRQQQNLQREFDRATSDWLKALVAPPGSLASQPTNSPERQAWGLTITGQYQDRLNDLGRQFDKLVTERNDLDGERLKHPLPEVTCGK